MIHFTPPPELHILKYFTFNVHSLAFLAGAVTAYVLTYKRIPEKYREHLEDLALYMTVAGILGARLMFAAINFRSFHSFWQLFAFWEGGLTSYGGFAGAVLVWIWFIKSHRLPMDVFCHALGPAALLGWGIGRMGCFLSWNGEIGTYTDVPWAFIVDGDEPRHPVMLYIALSHCIFALLSIKWAEKYKINAAALSLICFGAVRAILDKWRDYDPDWLYYGSVGLSLIYVIIGLWLLRTLPYPERASENGEGQKAETAGDGADTEAQASPLRRE